ncbi:MAG: thiamine diphosphokinase [Clostridiaceae bacterium]
MKVLIVSGGFPPEKKIIEEYIKKGFNFIIAADNGAKALMDLEIKFDIALGDFDSLPNEYQDRISLEKYNKTGEVIKYNSEKDFTDTEGAYLEAKKRGAKKIILLGATGNRYDHFLANLGVMKKALDDGISCEMVDGNNRIFLINKSMTIPQENSFISFSAFGEPVKNVTLKNVKYPLSNHTLIIGDP